MDTVEIFVVTTALLLIAFTIWFFFGADWGKQTVKAQNNVQPSSPHSSSPDTPLYACPMHPWITSTAPGSDCSICGMKLVRQE